MLEYIWFFALVTVSAGMGVLHSIAWARRSDYLFGWLVGAWSVNSIAFTIAWDKTGAVWLSAIKHWLPQQGEPIAEFTAYALVYGGMSVILFGVPLAASVVSDYFREKSRAQVQ